MRVYDLELLLQIDRVYYFDVSITHSIIRVKLSKRNNIVNIITTLDNILTRSFLKILFSNITIVYHLPLHVEYWRITDGVEPAARVWSR